MCGRIPPLSSPPKNCETEGREPSLKASCFQREIGAEEDFLESLLEAAVQLTAVFATAVKVYIAVLDRLHFYSIDVNTTFRTRDDLKV